MHVSSSTVEALWQHDQSVEFPGMVRIWPIRGGSIQWPNLFTLNDAAANALSDRMLVGMEGLKNLTW